MTPLETPAPLPADGTLYYSLPANLTIENVAAVAADLIALGLPGITLRLDASHTETITTPGIQLLLALGRSLNQANGRLLFCATHASVGKAYADAGIQPLPETIHE